jgi:hypothetical protein
MDFDGLWRELMLMVIAILLITMGFVEAGALMIR